MIKISTFYNKIALCLVLACTVSLNIVGLPYQPTIHVTNRTGMQISIITLDKPYTRSDVNDRSKLTVLYPGQTRVIAPAGRIVGWFKPGMPIGFTVLMPRDKQLTFVMNEGLIKSIHGELRDVPVNNTRHNAITVTTKNPHEGNENCNSCAQRCYNRKDIGQTLDFCNCLNTCYDASIDLNWYFNPHTRQHVQVGAGTKLSFAHVLNNPVMYTTVYDNDDYYDDEEGMVIQKKRVTIYQ